jgi:hypothetical protein
MPMKWAGTKPKDPIPFLSTLLLLVAILTKTLLALVRGHLVALAFFSAWHDCEI